MLAAAAAGLGAVFAVLTATEAAQKRSEFVARPAPPASVASGLVPTATPLPAALPATPGATPVPGAPPTAPDVEVDPPALGQGETALVAVRQPGATGGHVTFLGQRVPLVGAREAGEGVLWAVVGAPLGAPLGEATASVATRGPDGATLASVDVPLSVVAVERPVDYLVASPSVTAVLTPQAAETEAHLREFVLFNVFDGRPRWEGSMIMPAEGFITTHFGQGRSINGGPVTGHHTGTDIGNASGTPVRAAAAGRVSWAAPMPIRGNTVLIDHGGGVITGYSHLDSIAVDAGDEVEAGTTVGAMGSTGFSTGPHLHWELTIYGVNVDPMTWTQRAFVPGAP